MNLGRATPGPHRSPANTKSPGHPSYKQGSWGSWSAAALQGPRSIEGLLQLQKAAGNRSVASLVNASERRRRTQPPSSGRGEPQSDAGLTQLQRAPESHLGRAQPKTQNPTWTDAQLYVQSYFTRSEFHVHDLEDCKVRALAQFRNHTDAAFDESEGISLLETAILLVPVGGEVLEALEFFEHAEKEAKIVTALIEGAEKVAESYDKVHAAEAKAKIAATRTTFQSAKLEQLSDLKADLVQNLEQRQDGLRQFLEHDWIRYTPGTWDLEATIKGILGEIPPAEGFAEKVRKVRDQFELQLYKEYYVNKGTARWVTKVSSYYGTTSRPGLEGVPEKVRERVKELHGEHIWDAAKHVTEEVRTPAGAGNRPLA